jgi:hypothetical protein
MPPQRLNRRVVFAVLAVVAALALVALACSAQGLLPFGRSTPVIQCTPPLCQANESYFCPSGNCPGGCGTGCATHTPGGPTQAQAGPSPTPAGAVTTPVIQCTPPLCQANEDYYCPSGNCPGGCGTGCATRTPAAFADAGCAIAVRTPAPGVPTASVNGTPQPNRFVDPHVSVCVAAPEVSQGSELLILAQAVDIGVPIYRIAVRDEGAEEFAPLAEVRYDGGVTVLDGNASNVLAFRAARGEGNSLLVQLLGLAPGSAEVLISATGEIHWGSPGPASWGGGAAEPLPVTVVP